MGRLLPLAFIALLSFDEANSQAVPVRDLPGPRAWEAMGAEPIFGADGMTLESPAAAELVGAWFKPATASEGRVRVRLRFLSQRDPRRWVALGYRQSGGARPEFDLFTVRAEPGGKSGLEVTRRVAGRFEVLRAARFSGAFDPAQSHVLEVELRGPHVRCRLDGAVVLECWRLPGWIEGRFGLVVSGARVLVEAFDVAPLAGAGGDRLEHGFAPARPTIVGHRGASRDAPENTLAALRLAVERGADAVEFDVWATADGRVVLLHDSTLMRTTDLERVNAQRPAAQRIPARVEEARYEQLRALDAGTWKAERYRGEPVPLLSEALDLLRDRAIAVVEIKDVDAAAIVAEQLREKGMATRACVISFLPAALEIVHAKLPEVSTALLVGGQVPGCCGAAEAEELVARARRVHAACLSTSWRWITPPFARRVRELGMTLACWTVDDPELARHLTRCGVGMLTTNVPGVMREALR